LFGRDHSDAKFGFLAYNVEKSAKEIAELVEEK
jgi:hypothetical protein